MAGKRKTKKRSQSGKAKAATKPKRSFWWLKISLVAFVLAGIVLMYLDAAVRTKFEGKRWSLPAKVYARPLELYAGLHMSRAQLLDVLDQLGYRPTDAGSKLSPGTFRQLANGLELYTRGFNFGEGAENGTPLRLMFEGDTVTRTVNANDDQSVDVRRLEPQIIGGIYPRQNEDRVLVQLKEVPKLVIDTLTTVEDRDYWEHSGISVRGIGRAMWVNLSKGKLKQGGSTLTQQLVKNFWLNNDRTLIRKLLELPMAFLLELHYSKQEILEAYLNEIYLAQSGNREIHGFGLASQYYFAQPLNELKLHQIALLVGMVRGPSYYEPRRNPERALARRNTVLDVLREQGVITTQEWADAREKPLGLEKTPSYSDARYPAFLELVKRQLQADYRSEDLTTEGLQIFTTLDPRIQLQAESSVSSMLEQLEKRHKLQANSLESAVVVTSPDTGDVLALVGGRRARFAGFNRALDAKRQIGSLMKPVVYLTALQQPSRYHLGTLLDDAPISLKTPQGLWSPQNYDRHSHGRVMMIDALANSFNQATVHLGLQVGVPKIVKMAEKLGAPPMPEVPAVLLGAAELSPFEVATMYQTIASNGFFTPLRAIETVLNAKGEPLSRYPIAMDQRVDARAVFLLTHAMRQVMTRGTAAGSLNKLPTGLVTAGKTGTTDDQRDTWFAGLTGDMLTITWVGRDDNGHTPLTGATGALSVWTDMMQHLQPSSFNPLPPDSIQDNWVEAASGQPNAEQCQGARLLPLDKQSIPNHPANCVTPASMATKAGNWFEKLFEQ